MIGAGFLVAGVVLLVLDPPVRAAGEGPRPPAPPVREWLTAPLVAALLAIIAAVVAIMGTELAFIASLTGSGQAWSIAVVNAVWCVASLVGAYAYGAARRAAPMLLAALGAATMPAAFGGAWWTFALLLLGAGLFTAPTLAAGSDTIAAPAPDRVRGLVTGLQGSATTVGIAVATRLSGALADVASPVVAILVCGSVALTTAAVLAAVLRTSTGGRRNDPAEPVPHCPGPAH